MDLGKPQQAVRLLTRAWNLLAVGDREGRPAEQQTRITLQARTLITLANAEFELHGFNRAIERLDEAAAVVRRHGLAPLHISLGNQRGLFLLRAGRLAEAVREFDAAAGFANAPTDELCKVLLNRAVAHMDNFALAPARTDLERCIATARRANAPLLELKATHNLGYVEFLTGNLPAALSLMARAHDLDPTVAPGIAMLGRAEVLVAAGLTRDADDALATAAAIFRRDRLAQDLGETELERARCALISGEVDQSRRFAMRARDRFRRRGNDRWRRSAELVLLQGDLAAGRPGRRLTGPALRLREEFERDGVRLSARTAALIAAEAHLSAGVHEAARSVLAGLGRVDPRDPITARLHAHYVRARLDDASGHPGAASRRARTALADLAAYQASFGSIDLATAAAVHGRRLAELDLSIALGSGRPEALLEAAERGRAVSSRLPAVRPPEDERTADLLAELRQTVESLRSVEHDRAASEPLDRRRQELERQIAARGWTRSGGGEVREAASLEQVRGALDDTALVSYSRAAGRLHAVVLDSAGARLVTLGSADAVDEQVRRVRADLDVLAQPRLPEPLRTAVEATLRRSLGALDAALLHPLTISGALVVVTTGVLGQLPWGLLPSLRQVPVIVAPSAIGWHAAHTRPRSRNRRVVAIVGPDLGRGEDEVAAVGRVWDARVVSGAAATGAQFRHALAGARIAHVAAHGTHQSENPLFSSLRLADGPLFAHELDQAARTPEHVVLSACELGLATVRPGDEALGLTSVLLRLGTRSVVAGVARVGDDAAAATMADYHARLADRRGSAQALAEAVAAHATPFVCFGAGFRR